MVDVSRMEALVEFYGALADATRLKLIGLLAVKPMCGSELARELEVSAPTVSHHIGRLKRLELVKSVREDTTIYYALDTDRLHALNRSVFGEAENKDTPRPKRDERQKVLDAFFVGGRLKDLPVQRKKKLYALEEILKLFEPERIYTEDEVNEHIKTVFQDYCTIRREFIINGYMRRDKGMYQVNLG
ncbi:MAG: metalloregulator ArsR/SmtB family transcription factor [Thermaerobacter sp.]|nr:metalloregulator ArsR/SmtB family transcription factor [Thermaerobacter sp.]